MSAAVVLSFKHARARRKRDQDELHRLIAEHESISVAARTTALAAAQLAAESDSLRRQIDQLQRHRVRRCHV